MKNGLAFVVLLASFTIAAVGAADGGVEIFRDPWGTPHVFADTDQGAMFGLGYASAEDRHFQMCFNRLQSYTQVVDLGNPDASLSLLPFGNSERPDSPFRFASWAAWVRGELRPAPLSRKAVEKLSISRIILQPDAKDEVAGSQPDRKDAR